MPLQSAKLTDLDDPLRGRQTPAPATSVSAASPTKASSRKHKAAAAPAPDRVDEPAGPQAERGGDPYAGSPKIAVNMRATKQLWDHLGALTRELEGEGLRTSRTEMTEALWHFEAPEDADEARELVRRYRRARIG